MKLRRDLCMKPILLRFACLAGLLTVLIAAAFAYYLPIQDAYHPLNTDFNGCSQILQMYQNTTLLTSYDAISSGDPSSLLAIIGPNLEFTTHDSATIRTFLEAGGTVLLADNFGTGNQLLQALGVGVRISGEPIADLYFYTRNPEFPIAYDFSPNSLTSNLTAVVFNRPSYLVGANSSSTILVSSSPFSFIDLDQGHPVANETVGSYPMIAISNVGKGSLIVIADPNIFTNEMIGLFDNALLLRNLMRGHSHLIFDVVHLRTAVLTAYRIQLKQEIDSTRSFLLLSQAGAYVQWTSLIVIIVGFSFEIFRRIRRVKWAHISSRNYA